MSEVIEKVFGAKDELTLSRSRQAKIVAALDVSMAGLKVISQNVKNSELAAYAQDMYDAAIRILED